MQLLKLSKTLLILFSLNVCLVANAATIKGIFERGTDLVVLFIEILFVLAIAVFLWGIVKFIYSAGNPEKRKESKNLIIYGLIGLFVLFSFLGIIEILKNTVFGSSSYQSDWGAINKEIGL